MKLSEKQEKNQHEVSCQCNKITLLISCNKEQFPLWLFINKLYCEDCFDGDYHISCLLITKLLAKKKLVTVFFDCDKVIFYRWLKYTDMDKAINLSDVLKEMKRYGIVLNVRFNKIKEVESE